MLESAKKERIKGRRKRPGAGAITMELTDNGAMPTSFFQDRSNRTSGHWEKSDSEATPKLKPQAEL